MIGMRRLIGPVAATMTLVSCGRVGFAPADEQRVDARLDADVMQGARLLLVTCDGSPNGALVSVRYDVATATLTKVGETSVGANPEANLVTPDQRFVYVANRSGPSVSTISLVTTGMTTGKLDTVGETVVGAGLEPKVLALAPLSGDLLMGSRSTTIPQLSRWTRNIATGALSPLTGVPLASTARIRGLATATQHQRVYSANFLGGDISAISLNPSSVVTQPNSVTSPLGVAVGPSEKHLYVVGDQIGEIMMHDINADGNIGPMIQRVPVAAGPSGVVVSVDERSLYTYNYAAGSISAFNLSAATGQLSTLAEYSIGGNATGLAIDEGANLSRPHQVSMLPLLCCSVIC